MATKLWVPISASKHGWKVNKKAVEKAIKQLGIKNPVCVVKYKPSHPDEGGYHLFSNGRHFVKVARDIYFSSEATSIIWHELAHCVQSESYPSDAEFLEAYHNAGGNLVTASSFEDYDNNIFEVEARKIARENKFNSLCDFTGRTKKDMILEWLGL